jgi:hypothetical protein
VGGFSCTGVDRSTAVAYTLESVLKAVGDLTSTAAARHLDVRPLGPLARALIWRDSLGLLGGLEGDVLDMVRGVLALWAATWRRRVSISQGRPG